MAYYANAIPAFCGNILYSFSCVDVSSRNIKCKTGDLSFDFLARYSRVGTVNDLILFFTMYHQSSWGGLKLNFV